MVRIEKEKNLYKFWLDGKAKPYILDVNTAKWYGLRGDEIQNRPTAITMAVLATSNSSVCNLIRCGYPLTANLLSLADRLDALQINLRANEIENLARVPNLNLAVFAQFYREQNGDCSVREYVRHLKNKAMAEKYRLNINELDESTLITLLQVAETLQRRNIEITEKEMGVFLYWLGRGLYEYHNGWYEVKNRLIDIVKFSHIVNIPIEKSDFFRQYINLRRAYIAYTNAENNRKIAEHQNKKRTALTFEDENFITVIPMTVEELIAEGDKQGNCVGSYGSYIAEGKKCVVFIRHKDNPNKPYITCDIFDKGYRPEFRGTINQYLAHHNNEVRDPLAREFRQKFARHLLANWGE